MSTTKETIDALLAGQLKFGESGWGGLDNAAALNEEQQKQQQLRRYQQAREVAAPFMTTAGQHTLQLMREKFNHAPTWIDGLGLLQAVASGFAREGQNSVVRWIEDCIAVAQAGPPVQAAPVKEKKK